MTLDRDDAITRMAREAAKETLCAHTFGPGSLSLGEIDTATAIIARHYRSGVEELVRAARILANPKGDLDKRMDALNKLRKILEGFQDVE